MKTKKHKPLAIAEPGLLDLQIRQMPPRKRKAAAYYAGGVLEKHGYSVNYRELSFQTGYSSVNEIPVPARYYARQLLRLGFTHQLKLV